MTRSSLTEETASTPGWVESRIREIFDPFGDAIPAGAREAYVNCLAGVRGAVDVDTGHDRCRRTLMDAVRYKLPDPDTFNRTLEALEAEISHDT